MQKPWINKAENLTTMSAKIIDSEKRCSEGGGNKKQQTWTNLEAINLSDTQIEDKTVGK